MEPLSCSSQHRCDYQNEEGRLCAASFKRAWNLKRHIQEQHGSQPGDSHYSPGGESDRSPLPSTVRGPRSHDDHRPPPASRSWNGGPRTSLPPPAAAGVLRDPTDGTVPRMSIGAMISPGTMDHSSTAHPQAINNGPGSDSDTPAASTSLKRPAPITRPGSTTDLSEGDLSEGDGSSRPDIPPKRRHHRISLNSRGAQSARAPPVPIYDVKQSKKYGEQLRALSWLSCDAKTTFDEMYRVLLSQWGVQPTHQGTCVLIPEEWRLADPLELELEVADTFPKIDLPRAAFTYQDHGVSIGRALTWFSRWPRAGTELDNFLGCGPFQPMDASHLCHHDHCLIHLVYEAAHINLDRCRCRRRAVFLRQEGRPISEHCDQHSPPCLLQHASLTVRETYWIQFAVLRQARGLPPLPSPPRPRRYLFPTLEGQLPCSFPSVAPDPALLVAEPLIRKNPERPKTICKHCPSARSFASLYGFWAHLFQKHPDVSEDIRLEQMHKAARLWRAYWDKHSNGGKADNNTRKKLDQMTGADFCWGDVVDWGLR